MSEEKMELIYDGQCPLCRTYCTAIPSGNIVLIDARHDSETLKEVTRRGFDIDEGMVLKTGGRFLYGSEAMLELSRRLPARGWTGWVNRLFFNSPRRARIFYTPAKEIRNLLLKILGIGRINNLR
jgi:predicted DCC family thiol-disulfide oxidoreductase YuxK